MSSPTKAQRDERKAAGLCLYCGEEPPVELPDGRTLTYGEKCRAKNREAKQRHEAKKKAEAEASAAAGLNASIPAPAADEIAEAIAVEERGRQKMSRSKAEAFAAKKAAALAEGKCINCYKADQADSVMRGREGKKIQACAECRNKARVKKGLKPIPAPEPVIVDKPPAVKEVVAQSTTGRLNIKQLLIEQFGPKCFGCGASAVLPNGGIDEHFLTVDHIYPKKRPNGMPGNDELYNSGLLCDPCNRIKNNKLTVEQLRAHNASKNRLRVPYEELQDMLAVLDWAVKIHESRAADLAYQSLADFARAKRGIDGGG